MRPVVLKQYMKGVSAVMFTALDRLSEGETAEVVHLQCQGSLKRRLLDLGLVGGTHIRCLQKSPFGDPVAYDIRGAVIALRCEDAESIIVRR